MIVNAYCRDLGWLFEDLRRYFFDAGCAVSTEPTRQHADSYADAYLCIRSSEAHLCSHPERMVVQIHAMKPQWIGQAPQNVEAMNRAAAFVFTHYDQPRVLESMGVDLSGKRVLLRPIGAPESFRVRESMPEVFTAGWAGRDTGPNKRTDLFVEAMAWLSERVECQALILGSQVEKMAAELARRGVSTEATVRASDRPFSADFYMRHYHRMDALCITSESEAGPLPLFEALACGVPVVATDCGWCPTLVGEPFMNGAVIFSSNPDSCGDILGEELHEIAVGRDWYFDRRRLISATLWGYSIEGWIQDNIELAREVAHGRD